MQNKVDDKLLIKNKKIDLNYSRISSWEAGISLEGWELKSILNKDIKLDNSYVIIADGEAFLLNAYIKELDPFSCNKQTQRRKLLLRKDEIRKLIGLTQEKGKTLIPNKIYKKGNLIKLEFSLCVGKKDYNKKQDLKEKSINLDAQKSFKNKIRLT